MPLPDDVWCFLIGGDSTFSVNIDKTLTRTVDHLKKEIRKAPELNARAVDSLTLYRVAIDQSHDKKLRMRELTRLSENLEECTELDEWQRVSTTFGESPPAGKIYVVLVQTPEGESIYCEGVVRMANVAKTSGPLVILVQPPKVVSNKYMCIYSMCVSIDAVVSLKPVGQAQLPRRVMFGVFSLEVTAPFRSISMRPLLGRWTI